MRAEAADAGFYKSPLNTTHPKIQLLTVEDLLNGKGIDYSGTRQTNVTVKKAGRAKAKEAEPRKLF
jgi:hypothetical protein